MWGEFLQQATSIASQLESSLNESVGATGAESSAGNAASSPPRGTVEGEASSFEEEEAAVTKEESGLALASSATPISNVMMPYTPDSVFNNEQSARNVVADVNMDRNSSDNAGVVVDNGGSSSGGGNGGGRSRSLQEREGKTGVGEGAGGRNINADLLSEGSVAPLAPGKTAPGEKGLPGASPPPPSSEEAAAAAPPLADSADLQQSSILSKLVAKDEEVQLWKSRAIKLEEAAARKKAKASPAAQRTTPAATVAQEAYDELSKEASILNEKLHKMTKRLRELSNEKAAFKASNEKLQAQVEKVKSDTATGLVGSLKETEERVRAELAKEMAIKAANWQSEKEKINEGTAEEIDSLKKEAEELREACEEGKRSRYMLETKYNKAVIDKAAVEKIWVEKVRKAEQVQKQVSCSHFFFFFVRWGAVWRARSCLSYPFHIFFCLHFRRLKEIHRKGNNSGLRQGSRERGEAGSRESRAVGP